MVENCDNNSEDEDSSLNVNSGNKKETYFELEQIENVAEVPWTVNGPANNNFFLILPLEMAGVVYMLSDMYS